MLPLEFLPDQYVAIGQNSQHRLRYWSAGTQGEPLVLVHALGASVEFWGRVMPRLAQQHRVFALDLMGFGKSDRPDVPYSEAYMATVLRDFVDALGLGKINLIGNSMGGAVSMHYTRENPDKVARLGLLCSAGLGRAIDRNIRLLTTPLLGERLAKPSLALTKQIILGGVVNRRDIPRELVDVCYQQTKAPNTRRSFLRTLRGGVNITGQRSVIVDAHRQHFPQLQQPTLVMWSDKDPLIATDYLSAIKAIPRLQVHGFVNCGHYPQLEQPEEFARVVLNFLRQGQDDSAA